MINRKAPRFLGAFYYGDVMEELKKRILNLIGPQGTICHPKSDGRVEVPQLLIKQLGWKNGTIYIKSLIGEITIYKKDAKENADNIWEVGMRDGRIRIPNGLIKLANLSNKSVNMFICNEHIVVRNSIRSNNALDFINSLDEKQTRLLYSLFAPEFDIDKVKIDDNEIINQAGKQVIKDIEEQEDKEVMDSLGVDVDVPTLIMLDMTEPTVFRIVGGPFTFPAVYLEKKKQIVLASKGSSDHYIKQMYIIPGIQIKRKALIYGFLLVQEETFEEIRHKILENKKDFPEIILFFDSFTRGGFRVYINPPTDISNEYISNVQSICKEPLTFVKKMFEVEKRDDEVGRFPVIAVQNIKRL